MKTTDESALTDSNRAACFLREKKYGPAVLECNKALQLNPKHPKALRRRAKAYESVGDFERALVDIEAVEKEQGDNVEKEVKDTAKRLRDHLLMQRAVQARAQMQKSRAQQGAVKPKESLNTVKFRCVLDDDIRMLTVPAGITYYGLLKELRNLYIGHYPFCAKYKAKDSSMITITCKEDVAAAYAVSQDKGPAKKAAGLGGGSLPAPKSKDGKKPTLYLFKCPEREVPLPPSDEVPEGENGTEVYELDDWLIDFAGLFRQQLGIDPDGHVDLHNEGWEKCNSALDSALRMEEANGLLDQAAGKFQDVAASGLFNWGNVHICRARRILDVDSTLKGSTKASYADAWKYFALAEEKYVEALGVKADFQDAVLGIGQVYFEEAKLKQTEVLAKDDGRSEKEKLQEAEADINALFEKAIQKFQEAIALDKACSSAEEAKENDSVDDAKAEDPSVASHGLVMWGNVLYEQSQILGALGKEWKVLFESSIEKFKEAGCDQNDINSAIENHSQNKVAAASS